MPVLRTALLSIAIAGVIQGPPQQDVKANITEAAALIGKREFAGALKILEPLAATPAIAGDVVLGADVAYHLGNTYFLQNEYPKALKVLERSRELCRARPDLTCEWRAHFRITQAHKNQGQYAVALEHGLETVRLAEQLKNDDFLARTFAVVGSIQDLMGRFQAALESYRRSDRLLAGSKSPVVFAIMTETAITHKNLGNFDEALALYAKALAAHRANGDRLNQAVTLLNTGNVYRLLGQDDRALECFQESLAIVRDLNERRALTINLSAVGELLLDRGDTTRALALFTEQLQVTQSVGNRNEEGVATMNIASVHKARGDLDQAVARYEAALAIWREIGARTREAAALLALSELTLMRGDAASAAALSGQAIAIARDAAGPELEWRALHAGASAARARKQPDEAIAMLRSSAAIVNDLRANVSTDTDKIGFVDGRQAVFHDLAGVLVSVNRPEEGLEAAEAGRARAFADLLAQRKVEGKPAERQQLESLRTAIDESRRAAPASARAPGTRGAVIDERLTSLRADHAELASLLTADSPSSTEIKDTARRLNATLVEYLVAEKALLAWVVTPAQTIHAATIEIAGPKLQGLVDELRQQLDSTAAGPPSPRLTALSRQLNDVLIQPIAAWLPASPGAQVVIIPQGPLALLPFAALEDARGRPLVARHTLAFAPAISVFRYTAAKRQASPASATSALVVADAVGPAEAAMPPLPGAREEGRLVARRLRPGEVSLLVGPDATEAAFKRTAGTRRIVHVATHGLISADRPLMSSLLLAPGGGEDGYLRVDEIFSLALQADLVVLSGCSTGLGKSSGDGIIGLGRAFIYAGTPSVVVSQWDVSDRATTYLMDQFYASLRKGRGPAAALRDAQMATRAQFPNPALWAAFVAIGEPR